MRRKLSLVVILTLLLSNLSMLAIKIQPVNATETIYIRSDGSVDPDTAPISSVDNVTYTVSDHIYVDYGKGIVVERDHIVIDGAHKFLRSSNYISRREIGIELVDRNNVTIKKLDIRDFYKGIWLENSSNITIAENSLWLNRASVYLDHSSGNNIYGNDMTSDGLFGLDGSGILLYHSSGNNISHNSASGKFAGIRLYGSENIISNNRLVGSEEYGILFTGSNNSIFKNEIRNNLRCGIKLYDSYNNKIHENNITTTQSWVVSDGLYLDGSSDNMIYENVITQNARAGVKLSESHNNIFYHNTFIDNTPQVSLELSGTNFWDDGYPSGGNYWSDYTDRYTHAKEVDDSGIWDTPYVIDENNKDYYPLMNPITPTYPIPTLLSVNYPDSIEAGEWATITITATNDGTTAEWQTIHCGFPNNPPPENIEIISHDLNGGSKNYTPGSLLCANYSEYNITSTYMMVEGINRPWENGETHTMTVRVKPENTGTFTFYAKTVSRAESMTYYDPTSGTIDQQDEYVYVYEITVVMEYLNLIEDYFPYWWFSEGEKWFPTSFYFDNDSDVQNNTVNYDERVGTWNESFIYIHVSNTSESYLLIEYWLYYTWNDNHIWDGWKHKHDWDSTVVIAFDKSQDYAPSHVYFFHHGLKPYLSWNSPLLEKKDGTHIVTYVANGTHAAYPSKYMFPDDWSEGGEEYGPEDFNWIIVTEEVGQLNGDGDDHQFCLLEHWTIGIEQFEPNGGYWPHHYYDEDEEGAARPAPWHREDWDNLSESLERYLVLVVESPVHLFLTDPQEMRVGFDFNTKTVINEITGSMYTGTETEKQAIWIPNILDGKYEVKLIGIGEGSYTLTVGMSNASGIETRTFTGTVSTDQILTSIITVSSTDWNISSPSPASIIPLDRLIIISVLIVVGIVIAMVMIRKRISTRFKTTHKTKSVNESSDRRI